MRHYYRIPLSSPTGKKLRKFHHAAIKAAEAAEKYAARWGAHSYIGTFEAFEGGVEYLEFAEQPSLLIWRKVGHEWDPEAREFIYQYEPNVQVRDGWQVLPKGTHPSNTWDRIYMKDRHKKMTDTNGNEVWQVRFLEWYGSDEQYKITKRGGKKVATPELRRAIRAERERRALPFVTVQDFAIIVGMRFDQTAQGKKRLLEMETPTFYCCYDDYYISTPAECDCKDAFEIEQNRFTFMQGTAKRQAERK